MAASKSEIRAWLEMAKRDGDTHVIVVCDTFDWEDYPVFVRPGQDVLEVYGEYDGKNMQKVMEVYSTSMDVDAQLDAHRSYNF